MNSACTERLDKETTFWEINKKLRSNTHERDQQWLFSIFTRSTQTVNSTQVF